MKKFSKIMESTVTDSDIVRSIALLWDFLIYEVGMRRIIDDLLKPYSQEYNFNLDSKYQYPLSLLYKTGKFPDIRLFDNGRYWSPKLKFHQIRVKGVWHPVNKLNTNAFDQAELLVDIFRSMGILEEVRNIISDKKALGIYLKNFVNSNNIGDLLKTYGLKLSNYVSHNRENSAVGEKAEMEVADYLSDQGYKILYSGGDGDPIDMTYGCDLIVSKPGDEAETRPLTIQVKLREFSAVKASKKSNYSGIDLFYWSENGSIGCVGDAISLF
jgi:hypothetical protein